MRALLIAICVSVTAVALGAQVQSRPTDAPIVTAENDSWYVQGEPLQFAGDVYFRAGAAVFFDGNRMVRTGHYNGVPIYMDATLEPYSIVFVPIARGLMQPYERPRRGELAGTTGSRPPSFPVSAVPQRAIAPAAPSAPTNLPVPPGAVSAYTPETGAVGTTGISSVRDRVSEIPTVSAPPRVAVSPAALRAVRERVWVDYLGERWVSAGAAVPLEGSGLVQVGEYAGFPVYTRAGLKDDVIYLPAAGGLATPYRLKE